MTIAISSACNIDHVIAAIQQRKKPGPATLKVIEEALPKPIRPTKEILGLLLQEGIRDHRIWEFSAPKNQTAYWTQSPFELAAQKVRSLLEKGDQKESALKKTMTSAELNGRVDAGDILSRLVAEGQIFALPSASPSSQIEYSRSPLNVTAITTGAWQQLESRLQTSDCKGSELKKVLKSALRGILEPDEFIRAQIADKKLYLTSGTVGRPSATYSLSPIDTESAKLQAWNLIEEELHAKPQTEKQICNLIKSVLKGGVQPSEYVRSLIDTERLFPQPKKGKSTAMSFGLKPIDSTIDVQKLVAKLVADLEKLAVKNGQSEIELYEMALSELRIKASRTEPTVVSASSRLSEQSATNVNSVNGDDRKRRILESLHSVNPRVDEGELVLIRELRRQTELNDIAKLEFDRLMLEMFRDRQIVLSRQWSGNVPDADREELVTDGKGNFYNTAAVWRD